MNTVNKVLKGRQTEKLSSLFKVFFEHSEILACLCRYLMWFYRLALSGCLLVQMYLNNLTDFVFAGYKD